MQTLTPFGGHSQADLGSDLFRLKTGPAAYDPIADNAGCRQNAAMARAESKERYLIKIDCEVRTKDELFSRVTDTAYLGYSSFSGWDGFIDMLWSRLESSDILIEISNEDLAALSERDRGMYLEVLADALREFPDKLRLV